MDSAIQKENKKDYLGAIQSYEEEIENGTASVDTFINLSFIYWSMAAEQFGFNEPNAIPDEWSLTGGERYNLIIEKGIEIYKSNAELQFWYRYYKFGLYGDDFSMEDCISIMKNTSECSLVPYFYLYQFDKEKYKEERELLVEVCKGEFTAKNLYIYSIIG